LKPARSFGIEQELGAPRVPEGALAALCQDQDYPLPGQNRPLPPLHAMRRSGQRLVTRLAAESQFTNKAHFLKSWFNRPLMTGSVYPSGKALARTMARFVDPALAGPVIELGPGTGPVTEALIARGIAEERLVLVEFSKDFCRLLRKRFPRARVVEGDAYNLAATLSAFREPAAAVVSSLPLMTRPEAQRLDLLRAGFAMMPAGCPFIQFTYATVSPMSLKSRDFDFEVSPRVWLNLPPARVWVYRNGNKPA
jgi:phosphatidylethanolamine/phosphatidyl-N-methylethanolamine N-methyltransferase